MKKKYYAVLRGLYEGVYEDKDLVEFSRKIYLKSCVFGFETREEAEECLKKHMHKIKNREKNVYAVFDTEKGVRIADIHKDMSLKINTTGKIRFFKNKKDLINFVEKKSSEEAPKIDIFKLTEDLFDVEVLHEEHFNEPQLKNNLIAYIDGSFCTAGNFYKSGIALFENRKEGVVPISQLVLKGNNKNLLRMKNASGEIVSSSYCMHIAKKHGYAHLEINYDFLPIEEVCKNRYISNYLYFIYNLYYEEVSKTLEVSFKKVKSHSNNVYNEVAHKLARGST